MQYNVSEHVSIEIIEKKKEKKPQNDKTCCNTIIKAIQG